MNPQGRPPKWRRVTELPIIQHFRPEHVSSQPSVQQGTAVQPVNPAQSPGQPSDLTLANTNFLLVEEFEAIRLKDYLGLEQEDCANHMQVSRATFQRILSLARSKIANSLIQGKVILITGGHYGCKPCAQCRRGSGHGRHFRVGEDAETHDPG